MGLQGQVLIFVIPAKAGIQMAEAKFTTRSQVQTAAGGSLLPLWGKARMGESRASSPRPAANKSILAIPLWEKAGMRATRASAAVRAGRPRSRGEKT